MACVVSGIETEVLVGTGKTSFHCVDVGIVVIPGKDIVSGVTVVFCSDGTVGVDAGGFVN